MSNAKKYGIDVDEWYPVFTLFTNPESLSQIDLIELTDEEYQDYKRVMEEFNAWQKRLYTESV